MLVNGLGVSIVTTGIKLFQLVLQSLLQTQYSISIQKDFGLTAVKNGLDDYDFVIVLDQQGVLLQIV